ncbi:hypothetical protein BGZ60DRAFT_379584 [Tricladium varicosporioides]|nr:hypothetical protein BGZ60DRAFT_379584 [Hymenoscyphus varicosporioides]
MPPERTPKRVRQACEPCRRKKSKCPAEKPACSCCTRLGQQCVYPNDFSAVEAKSSHPGRLVRYRWKPIDVVGGKVRGGPAGGVVLSLMQFRIDQVYLTSRINSLPSWASIEAAGTLYLLYCDCQPLPLFHRENFVASLRNRESSVLFSILALTARFSDLDPDIAVRCSSKYAEQARRLVARAIFEGSVRLSTLQSLCLLHIVDFTGGNTQRASLDNCIAMELAHCAGLTTATYTATNDNFITKEERRRCFWSILLCKRLHGTSFSTLHSSLESGFPPYPKSLEQPLPPTIYIPEVESSIDESQSPRDDGVLAYMIQLTEVWYKTTQYARRRGKPSQIPPWSSQSEYSTIVSQQMDFETKMPYRHRFKLAKFSSRTSQELNSNRGYWGPWLFIQFLYHTNICLLNHPLLLSLRLRNFRSFIPEMFLQQTSDLISSHATWIVRFIDMLDSKAYKVSDPFLGHCAAIVATIHLQFAYTDPDIRKREEKQKEFGKCLKFVRLMGEQWPNLAQIAEKLQRLESVVKTTNHATSQSPQIPTRGMLINLGCFWEVLEYCSSSSKPRTAQNLISPELFTSNDGPNDEVSLASPLPDTFRLHDYNSNETNNDPANKEHMRDVPGVQNQIQVSNTMNMFPETTGTISQWNNFSEDELAVLADNFFEVWNPNSSLDDATGWWKYGNL